MGSNPVIRIIVIHCNMSRKLGSFSRLNVKEMSIHMLLVRAQFCQTLASAKQLIRHGKVRINGQKVTFSKLLVLPGQCVSLSSQSDLPISSRATQIPPSHIEINWKTCSFVVLYEPKRVVFA